MGTCIDTHIYIYTNTQIYRRGEKEEGRKAGRERERERERETIMTILKKEDILDQRDEHGEVLGSLK